MTQALAGKPIRSVRHVAFGDLFLTDVRAYREERLGAAGKVGVFPLWGRDTAVLAKEMITSGFEATVVCVDPRALPASFAGREFDETLLADLPEGVDPCGEAGEFHTFVWSAPMFSAPIACHTGEIVTREGFVFCDVISGASHSQPKGLSG
jgi:diphthamide synthase (EF-2-diphthine--ammonia ligase)